MSMKEKEETNCCQNWRNNSILGRNKKNFTKLEGCPLH